eukprot:gene20813-22856_t
MASRRIELSPLETDVSLTNLLSKARAYEASERQATGIEHCLSQTSISDHTAHAIRFQCKPPQKPQFFKSNKRDTKPCGHCGGTWPHNKSPCPAQGQTCHKCGKNNHFAKVCRSGFKNSAQPKGSTKHAVRHVLATPLAAAQAEPNKSDEEYLFTLSSSDKHAPKAQLTLNEMPLSMIIDTGASINIIDEHTYKKFQEIKEIPLTRGTTRIFDYGAANQLPVLGTFEGTFESDSHYTVSPVHVVTGNHGCLLSYKTASALGLIQVKVNTIKEQQQQLSHEKVTFRIRSHF